MIELALKILKKIQTLILIIGFIFLISCVSKVPKNYGKVESELFLSKIKNQPLIVAIGGSEGGMIYAEEPTKEFRDKALANGYAILSIGYFGTENTPSDIDRISLDAIYDTIQNYRTHPLINGNIVAILGSSRGGELVLNLASKYEDFSAIIVIAPSNVSLPNQFGGFQKSSWTFKGEEIPFIKAPSNAIKIIRGGNFYDGMVKILDDKHVIEEAAIPVEKIKCPILIISAKNDEVWPSTKMSELIIQRLKKNNFKYNFEHVQINSGHEAPSNDIIFNFLDENFKNEKPTANKL